MLQISCPPKTLIIKNILYQRMRVSLIVLRDSLFAVFYIMTEQNEKDATGSRLSWLLCTLMYSVDAGQVLRALILTEFGWNADIVKLIKSFDTISLFFQVVISVSYI